MFAITTSLAGPLGPRRELVLFRRSVQCTVVLCILLVLGTVFGSVPAFGYWAASGGGNTTATVGILSPPTNVSSSAVLSTIAVSWSASAGPLVPAGYYVTRISNGTPMPACGSGPAILIAASSCSDTSVAAGSHKYVVTAVYRSWTAISAASAAVTVIMNLSDKVAFTTQPPGNVIAGTALTGLRVQLRSVALGLPIPQAGVSVTISMGANPAGGTLSGSLTVNTDAKGAATFNDVNIKKAGTGYTLVASSPGYEGTVSSSFTVTAAAATQLVVTSPTSVNGVASGTTNIGPITVERRDMHGNPTSVGAAALALQTNPVGTGYFATAIGVSGPYTLSIPAGSASASFYYGNKTKGSASLQFSAPGLIAPQAISVGVTAASPSKLVFDAIGPVVKKYTSFSSTIRVLDAFNNQTTGTAQIALKSIGQGCTVNIPTSSGSDRCQQHLPSKLTSQ
jgi:hypothetical protein